MNKIFNLFLMVAFVPALSSCGDDPVNKVGTEFPAAASYVYSVDKNTGDAVISDGCYMKTSFNMTDGKVDFRMDNVRYDGSSFMMLEFENQPWTADKAGIRTVALSSLPATVGGRMVNVTNFKMTYLDRYLGDKSIPVLVVTMQVEDRYEVTVLQRSMIAFGKTSITTNATGEVYETNQTYYQVFLDKADMKADVKIYDPKFAANMPAMSLITIPDVPFSLSETGYELAIDEVTPIQENGSPNPRYNITDLKCEGVYGAAMKLDCTVSGIYGLSATLSENGVLPE